MNELEKAAARYANLSDEDFDGNINLHYQNGFVAGSEWHKSTITAEDVKRWFQILVGKGEYEMEKDILKTLK